MPRRRTHAPTATGGRVGKDAPDEQAPEAHHQVVRRLASVGDRARAVSDDQEGKQRSHTPRAKAWKSAAARAAHAVGATHTGPSAKESTRRSEACATARGRTPSHALARTPVKRGRRRLSRRSCGGCRWPRPNKGRVDRSVRMAHAMEARGTGRTGRQRRCGRLPPTKNEICMFFFSRVVEADYSVMLVQTMLQKFRGHTAKSNSGGNASLPCLLAQVDGTL